MKEIYARALRQIMLVVMHSKSKDPVALKCMQLAQDALIEAGKQNARS